MVSERQLGNQMGKAVRSGHKGPAFCTTPFAQEQVGAVRAHRTTFAGHPFFAVKARQRRWPVQKALVASFCPFGLELRMDILNEIDQLIKLLEVGYKDSALVALRAIRKELVDDQKPTTNNARDETAAKLLKQWLDYAFALGGGFGPEFQLSKDTREFIDSAAASPVA